MVAVEHIQTAYQTVGQPVQMLRTLGRSIPILSITPAEWEDSGVGLEGPDRIEYYCWSLTFVWFP